jgi:hypothetical protein
MVVRRTYLEYVMHLFRMPPQIEYDAFGSETYVSAQLTPAPGRWVCLDVELAEGFPFDAPRTLVTCASDDAVWGAAERSLSATTDPRNWSPASHVPALLMSLLADLTDFTGRDL